MQPTLSDRADALEHEMAAKLEREVAPIRSPLFTAGERDPREPRHEAMDAVMAGKKLLMGPDPRLPPMPAKATLIDFFNNRFGFSQHMLQSARLALNNGHGEKVAMACLLHDISVIGLICGDHGYWGAQLVAPYVDEEVAWGIQAHQVLRFYPDESVGYAYPEAYVQYFGEDFVPEPYVREAYEQARQHKWYMTGRLITLNDIYAFDPSVKLHIDDFTDLIGRNFRQPEEGLGLDHSSSAHMWRTMMWPTRAL